MIPMRDDKPHILDNLIGHSEGDYLEIPKVCCEIVRPLSQLESHDFVHGESCTEVELGAML